MLKDEAELIEAVERGADLLVQVLQSHYSDDILVVVAQRLCDRLNIITTEQAECLIESYREMRLALNADLAK